jgi:hypothetical protein|tara:strand:+ start:352 stop:516 length:165 start_codon:yes stop_codon:yes gene_type:complete
LKQHELKTLSTKEVRDALNEQELSEKKALAIAKHIKEVCLLTAKIISNEESRII